MSETRAYKKATIAQVANLAGVSATTVSHVVSGRRAYATETVERVRRAIDTLNYVPSYAARGLRQQATKTIGLSALDPFTGDSLSRRTFSTQLWQGVVREADLHGYSILHYSQSIREGMSVEPFLNGQVDGVLLTDTHDDTRSARLARSGLPIVVQARIMDIPEGVAAVHANEADVVHLAMHHLWSLGHRRIAHIAGPVRREGLQLIGGWKDDDIANWRLKEVTSWLTLRDHFDPELIGYANTWEPDLVPSIIARFKSMPHPPTAVFCANDGLALAAIQACRELGWDVPGDLSVIGVDDIPESQVFPIPLTSVRVPVTQIGEESVRALIRIMNGAAPESNRIVIPVTELIWRTSTGSPSTRIR
jgi:LacI family transcriptional regulator